MLFHGTFSSTLNMQFIVLFFCCRFCGPATSWSLKIPGDHQSSMLPKTNADSVRMTGCLFKKPVLQPEQWDVLKEAKPLVFLEGPPASGKTRTLVLAGIRWMVEGHTVHVVSTRRESHAASRLIHSELERFSIQKQRPRESRLVVFNDEDVNERVKRIVRFAGKGSLYILADEAGPCEYVFTVFLRINFHVHYDIICISLSLVSKK